MISASFMQVSDAHLHRRNRRRSASVARSSATPPRRAMARKTTPCGRVCPSRLTRANLYDLSVLLALNPIKVYESIISSGIAGTEYGRLPWLALSVMSGHTSNAASEPVSRRVAIRLRSLSCRTCRLPCQLVCRITGGSLPWSKFEAPV